MKKEEYRVIIQRGDSNLTTSSKIHQFQICYQYFPFPELGLMLCLLFSETKFPHDHSNFCHMIYLYRCVLRTWRGPGCGWWCGWGLSWGVWPSSSRALCLCTTCIRMTSSKPSTTPREKVSGTQREQLHGQIMTGLYFIKL